MTNKMDRYVADELTLCDTERKFPQNEVFIVDDVYEEIVEQLPSVTPSYNSIKTELKPYEDSIRELIKEFDDKHPALFADYMQEFNNHPISEIIEYMWDMHDLIEDIRYRLPNESGAKSEE